MSLTVLDGMLRNRLPDGGQSLVPFATGAYLGAATDADVLAPG
jgi:hypothetical protein